MNDLESIHSSESMSENDIVQPHNNQMINDVRSDGEQKSDQQQKSKLLIRYDRMIGKGSFSEVYSGQYKGIDVAVKVISTDCLDGKITKQLQRELQVIRVLHANPHKNIVTYYKTMKTGSQKTGSQIIIVMELCSGGELLKYIKCRSKFDVNVVQSLFSQIISGYKHLLNQNIVHRDIKSANILLSQDQNTIKFIDFGLSKILSSDLNQTICGSPLYMAPELLNHKKYDSKSDIWSIGVLLYEMVYGVTPFHQCKAILTLKQTIKENSIKYPDTLSDGSVVPNYLITLMSRLLEPDPCVRITWRELDSLTWEELSATPMFKQPIEYHPMFPDSHSNNISRPNIINNYNSTNLTTPILPVSVTVLSQDKDQDQDQVQLLAQVPVPPIPATTALTTTLHTPSLHTPSVRPNFRSLRFESKLLEDSDESDYLCNQVPSWTTITQPLQNANTKTHVPARSQSQSQPIPIPKSKHANAHRKISIESSQSEGIDELTYFDTNESPRNLTSTEISVTDICSPSKKNTDIHMISNIPSKKSAFDIISRKSLRLGSFLFARSAPIADSVAQIAKSTADSIGSMVGSQQKSKSKSKHKT